MGSPLNRLLYAIKFRELNILLSGAINSYSKILYDRQPLARVAKVAPFLTLDGNPYPVVANGQILWVVDGYTTTDLYPYSERISMRAGHLHQPRPRAARWPASRPAISTTSATRSRRWSTPTPAAVTLYQWGARRPDAADLDEGVPRASSSRARTSRPP